VVGAVARRDRCRARSCRSSLVVTNPPKEAGRGSTVTQTAGGGRGIRARRPFLEAPGVLDGPRRDGPRERGTRRARGRRLRPDPGGVRPCSLLPSARSISTSRCCRVGGARRPCNTRSPRVTSAPASR
jgi:hypothetical protein